MKANHNRASCIAQLYATMVNIGMSKNESKSQLLNEPVITDPDYGKYRHVKE